MGLQNPFDYFNHVFVINVASQAKRLRRVTLRLARVGIEFQRIEAVLPIAGEGRADKAGQHLPQRRAHGPVRVGAFAVPNGNRLWRNRRRPCLTPRNLWMKAA
jgi:GR25 family glycosyltransferase involved in LPS biosynthesis